MACIEKPGVKCPKAAGFLTKDPEALLALFDFPAEHGGHLSTSNHIESVVGTIDHGTVRSKGCLPKTTARLMVFKLATATLRNWQMLKGENRLPKVISGVTFKDAAEVISTANECAA